MAYNNFHQSDLHATFFQQLAARLPTRNRLTLRPSPLASPIRSALVSGPAFTSKHIILYLQNHIEGAPSRKKHVVGLTRQRDGGVAGEGHGHAGGPVGVVAVAQCRRLLRGGCGGGAS